jgi:hypothetical protein
MMPLRMVAFAFAAVLVYSLYLPSSCPPQRFVEQVRREHDLNVAFWGADHAAQILSRALSLYGQRDQLAPAAFASTPGVPITAANAAVTQQMSDVVQRLFHNRYAQGFDAVVLLASYRLSAIAHWLPWAAGLGLLACFDASIVRLVRSKEFVRPGPACFALCATAATLVLALLLLLLVVPVALDPTLLGGMPLLLGALIAWAIRHSHA